MWNDLIYQHMPAALLAGTVFGAARAMMIVSLNTDSLPARRSRLKVWSGLIVFYLLVLFTPLLIGIMIIDYLPWIESFVAGTLLLSLVMVLTAADIFSQSRIYSLLWPASGRNAALLYALGLVIASFMTFFGPKMAGFDLSCYLVAFMVFSSFALSVLLCQKAAGGPAVTGAGPDRREIVSGRAVKHKLLWIGLDSATWDVITPMIKEGKLPTIAAMMDEGSHGRLKTIVPTYSPVVWTTMATGKTPLKHGIRYFLLLDPKGVEGRIEILPVSPLLAKAVKFAAGCNLVRRRPVGSRERRVESLWNILSGLGYQVGVASWFVTDPVEPINGFMVPEFFYTIDGKGKEHDSVIHPHYLDDEVQKIRKKIQQRFQSPEAEKEVRERFLIRGPLTGPGRKNFDILKMFYFMDILRVEVTDHLWTRFDVDALMVYFHGIDAVQHRFWDCLGDKNSPFRDVIPRYYEYVDGLLQDLFRKMEGPKSVIVSSDHGHGTSRWYETLYAKIMRREAVAGSHSYGPDGIFIAMGEGIKGNLKLEGISVFDLVPTILPLMGLPVGRDMDGRPILEMFTPDVPDPRYIETYEGLTSQDSGVEAGDSENAEVLERLRNLGYID